MAGPETDGGAEGTAPDDVVRPGTGVVRPGTGVVRPGSGTGAAGNAGVVRPGGYVPPSDVVRPGTDVVRPDTAPDGAAKAVAAVPEAPEAPPEPIHIVLPVIEVKPVKQGFLDRLVAGKTEAEKAEEAARKEEEARRKADEAQRKVEERARAKEDEAQRKAAEKAREEALEARREAREAERKARSEAEEKERKAAEKARKELQKAEEAQRRAEERARLKEAEEEEEEEVPPRPAPPRPAPAAPPRPGPGAPPRPVARPAPGRPMPAPGRQTRAPLRYDEGYDDRVRARRPLWHWVVAVVALAALGGGSAAVASSIAPPPTITYRVGIDTGDQAPILGGLDQTAAVPSQAGLEAALASLVGTTNLGPSPALTVADVETGRLLWDVRGDAAMTPASSAKVLTAAAVLHTRGPNYRIPTRAVAGANPGDVVLVGGGDPTLAVGEVSAYHGAARLDTLAEQVRTALGGAAPSRVIVDSTLFPGPNVSPNWNVGDVNGGVVSRITALMIDGARANPTDTSENPARHPDPDMAAGRAFADLLGIPQSQVVAGAAPANGRVLGEVLSPPVASIVERTLAESDNTLAEMLARQVALAKGMPASFDGAAQANRDVLTELGVPTVAGAGLVDGSGLSYANRVTTNQLTTVLLKASSPEYPDLRTLISGLAVAGYSGTMDEEHGRQRAGRGIVRAKTGTLSTVNALVGFVVDSDGRLLAFAAIANNAPNRFVAEPALDRIAERLSRCGCS